MSLGSRALASTPQFFAVRVVRVQCEFFKSLNRAVPYVYCAVSSSAD